MDGADAVVDFTLGLRWEDAPEAARARAYECLLDIVGSLVAGTMASSSRIGAAYAARSWRGDESTILLHGLRASPAGAAFANAVAANAIDIDDDELFVKGHPGAHVFPAVLALTEATGASGRRLLEALLVGYEVGPRVGRCWHLRHSYFRACGSWGAVVCAAVAARLLGLTHEQTRHALGIAEYFSPDAPMMRDIFAPTMVKHAHGWGAMTGVSSAQLAREGFTGIDSILGDPEYAPLVTDIGQDWVITYGMFFKRWCSCAWGHAALHSALRLKSEHALEADQIERVRVLAYEEAVALYQGYPTTTEQAQFAVQWPLACLLLDGEVGPRQILEERFDDPRVRALVDRIEMVLDPEVDALYQQLGRQSDMRCRVEITTKDGRVLDSGINDRGHPQWDAAMLEAKFRWLAGHVLDSRKVDDLVAMIWSFEELADIQEFTAILR